MGNIFAAGRLWAIPTYDGSGSAITTPTPVQFGSLQDITIDIGFDLKKLYGNKRFADDLGAGKGTITGKASFGKIDCYRCVIGGLPGAVIFPEMSVHGLQVIEVISPFNLRKKLSLVDGSKVSVEMI